MTPDAQLRDMCRQVLDQTPAAGLQEAFESLVAIRRFHVERAAWPASATEPPPKTIKVVWGDQYDRPVFHAEPDDEE